MLSQRLYFLIKPLLPWRVRIGMRRVLARLKRRQCRETWPISEAAGRTPRGWAGWPDGRKFALVLTHDVEGPEGLAKCQRLAELEMELGFRSSFNFIPEGTYHVPADLRAWLVDRGFEIGVHDLEHNGRLFGSRRGFLRKAARINHYLGEWNAAGFRSGFMLRNLGWLHRLNIRYDSSTFDTDPFELQSNGADTIFPFWIPTPSEAWSAAPFRSPGMAESARARGGYVELPYTLPQDSTLFLVLKETSPQIWIRKLEWIIEHGGMALVNVHPDYLRFADEKPSARTFPVERYAEFLRYVRDHHANVHWPALPRQVAAHLSSSGTPPDAAPPAPPHLSASLEADAGHDDSPPKPRKASAGRIVMLVENSYPDDTRVRNEATLLAAAGYRVSVISLRKPGRPRTETIDGVKIYRIPRLELFQKTAAGPLGPLGRLWMKLKVAAGYCAEYAYFTSACFLVTTYVFLRHGFDVIHAHNPPDTLFVVALPFRLIGKKFVFDHHDLCPELYQSRYGAGECLQTRILRAAEWASFRTANITIATNESYKAVQIRRGRRRPETIFVVRNGPAARRMARAVPNPRLRSLNRCILAYIGSLNPQDGVDYLLRSLRHLRHDLGRNDFHCIIMGSGDSLGDLRALATRLELDACVELTGFIPDDDLLANLAAADICVDPDPSSPLNDVSTWIKIMEYMAATKPIVTFELKETRYSAQDAAVYVPPNDELAFAKAIAGLMDDPEQRRRLGELGRQRVENELQWSVVGRHLLRGYDYLIGPPAGGGRSGS
jgi:glycosyltransferase involved in cell wall biosynthesis